MRNTSSEDSIGENAQRQPAENFYRAIIYERLTCAICGCDEDHRCFDGERTCFWVTMNKETNAGLCSECLGF